MIKLRVYELDTAALVLWWLDEGSDNGFDIEQAGVNFQVFILYYKKLLKF